MEALGRLPPGAAGEPVVNTAHAKARAQQRGQQDRLPLPIAGLA